MRTFRLHALALIGSALLAAPAAEAAPPSGDNRAAPIDIALNSTITVKRIEDATLEAPSDEDPTCDADGNTTHSVWFRFTTPMAMVLDLDATGALIASETGLHSSLLISYFEDVGGVITHRGCTGGDDLRLEDLILDADEVYYFRIANSGAEPTGPSIYKLSVRVRHVLGTANPEFVASEPLGTRWMTRRASPSQIERVCSTPPSTDCVIDFAGVAKGELFQKVDFDKAVMRFRRGDYIFADASIFRTPPQGVDVTLKIKIKYSDGKRPTTVSATRHFTNTETNIARLVGAIVAKVAGQVKSITYSISSPSADDVFSVLTYSTGVRAGS